MKIATSRNENYRLALVSLAIKGITGRSYYYGRHSVNPIYWVNGIYLLLSSTEYSARYIIFLTDMAIKKNSFWGKNPPNFFPNKYCLKYTWNMQLSKYFQLYFENIFHDEFRKQYIYLQRTRFSLNIIYSIISRTFKKGLRHPSISDRKVRDFSIKYCRKLIVQVYTVNQIHRNIMMLI